MKDCYSGILRKLRSHQLSDLKPLKDLYLGTSFSDNEIKNYLTSNKIVNRYKISKHRNINKVVNLFPNEIVARFDGRMDLPRSLGNRSILANPSDFATIEKIN